MIRPSLRIPAVAALTASLLTAGLLTAAPASANVGVGIDNSGLRPDGGSTTSVPNLLASVSNNDGTRTVAFSCEGLSTGPALATTMNGCNLKLNGVTITSAPTLSAPGPVVASAGQNGRVGPGTITVCASVTTTYADGTFGISRLCTPPLTQPV